MIFLPLCGIQQSATEELLGRRRSASTGPSFRRFRWIGFVLPFVANAFARTIIFRPAGFLGISTLQPLVELFRRHVHRVIEVSILRQECMELVLESSLDHFLIAFTHFDRGCREAVATIDCCGS